MKPIRTGIIETLMDVLHEQLPDVKTFRVFAAPPTDVVGLQLPALYLIERQAEDRGYSNRIATARMHLMIQIFVRATMNDSFERGYEDMFATFDELSAKLHGAFHLNVGLSKNGLVNLVEIQYDRIITNDSVGVLTSTFDIEYRHDRGNAFS